MNRYDDLRTLIREECRRKGVSLRTASKALGKSPNWLERIVNYDPSEKSGIKRPRVEACKDIARYFGLDPNHVLQAAGYISLPPPETPVLNEISLIANNLNMNDRQALLDYARLLKLRNLRMTTASGLPAVGIAWEKMQPQLAEDLAAFVELEPATIPVWIEALNAFPEDAVRLLLINVQNQVYLRDQLKLEPALDILASLAHHL